MKEMAQMVIVLTLICGVCALGLASFRDFTAERIENQVLKYVQGPKVTKLLEGSDNDLLADRQKVRIGDEEKTLFIGKKNGKPWAIAYETKASGFEGDITVMVGYDLEKDKLTGIQIIKDTETPGIGKKINDEQFTSKFKGLATNLTFALKSDRGDIDGISGATYSARGVATAVGRSANMYAEMKKGAENP